MCALSACFLSCLLNAVSWQHPGGLVTLQTLEEVRHKLATQAWAPPAWENRKAEIEKWASLPSETLRGIFPKQRGNVYHNFSCPDCRIRLDFDPFNPFTFICDACGKKFPPETDAGIYGADDNYHGTMYDGWICLFFQDAAWTAADLALMGRVENNTVYLSRSRELLILFAETVKNLPTDHAGKGDQTRILTYHREGDNKILADLAKAYEMVRDGMAPELLSRVSNDVIERMLNDVMLEPVYTYDHNNIYQWYRTILQAAVCLERDDLVDWCFGYGAFTPEKAPEHRSLRRIAKEHFLPDGAYWELCSGYHLYPMYAFCDLAVLSHNLSLMDPQRFSPEAYDCTCPRNFAGETIKNALEWFISMAMPDRTMTVIGDSMSPRSGMDDYLLTAEVGYRYFDVRAVGDYETLRNRRSWQGLLYGTPEILKQETTFASSCLASGWVSLRNEFKGNRLWVGLNALKPGGGHQHADRLTLTLYNHGQLLALEKATPYNESVTRVLGTQTPSHNTVVIDRQSQKQGEALAAEEIPEIAHFFNGDVLKSAELRGDRIYPQTDVYRRCVGIVEDIVVDCFVTRGGACRDWLVHHAGGPPELSTAMEEKSFEPVDWLYNGGTRVLLGDGASDWHAVWKVEDVISRLTMAGVPATQVYQLETFPLDNAVVTKEHPPCQTLCVRREKDVAFLAVWDAWKDVPNLKTVESVTGENALILKTQGNIYYFKFGEGTVTFPDGVVLEGDANVSLLRNRDVLSFAGGTCTSVTASGGSFSMGLNAPGCAEITCFQGTYHETKAPLLQYDTYGGNNHPRNADTLDLHKEGTLLSP